MRDGTSISKRLVCLGLICFILTTLLPIRAGAEEASRIPTLIKLTEMEYDYAQEFKNGYAFAVKGVDAGYVDSKGDFTKCYEISSALLEKMRISGDSLEISPEGLYPYFDAISEKWGVKDLDTGDIIVPIKYEGAAICQSARIIEHRVEGTWPGPKTNYFEVYDTLHKV